jgi:hypothetical protein
VGFTGHGKNRVPWVLIKKDPLSDSEDIQWSEGPVELDFFDSNSAFFTDFNTTFAAQTFFCIDRHGFAVLHFKYFNRANIYTFFAACTFFFVNIHIKGHIYVSFQIGI